MIKPIKRTRRVLELPVADIRPQSHAAPGGAFRQPELQDWRTPSAATGSCSP